MAVGKVLFLCCNKYSLFSEAFMQGDQVAAVPRYGMETFFSGPHVNRKHLVFSLLCGNCGRGSDLGSKWQGLFSTRLIVERD